MSRNLVLNTKVIIILKTLCNRVSLCCVSQHGRMLSDLYHADLHTSRPWTHPYFHQCDIVVRLTHTAHTHLYACMSWPYTYIYTHIHTAAVIPRTAMYIHIHIHVYVHTCMHTPRPQSYLNEPYTYIHAYI
jgi:hypothetical protein